MGYMVVAWHFFFPAGWLNKHRNMNYFHIHCSFASKMAVRPGTLFNLQQNNATRIQCACTFGQCTVIFAHGVPITGFDAKSNSWPDSYTHRAKQEGRKTGGQTDNLTDKHSQTDSQIDIVDFKHSWRSLEWRRKWLTMKHHDNHQDHHKQTENDSNLITIHKQNENGLNLNYHKQKENDLNLNGKCFWFL